MQILSMGASSHPFGGSRADAQLLSISDDLEMRPSEPLSVIFSAPVPQMRCASPEPAAASDAASMSVPSPPSPYHHVAAICTTEDDSTPENSFAVPAVLQHPSKHDAPDWVCAERAVRGGSLFSAEHIQAIRTLVESRGVLAEHVREAEAARRPLQPEMAQAGWSEAEGGGHDLRMADHEVVQEVRSIRIG